MPLCHVSKSWVSMLRFPAVETWRLGNANFATTDEYILLTYQIYHKVFAKRFREK